MIDSLSEKLLPERADISIGNVTGAERGLILSRLADKVETTIVVIVPAVKDVEPVMNDLAFFYGKEDGIVYFPPYNILPFKSLSYHTETAATRIRVLNQLATEKPPQFLVTTSDTMMQRLIPKREIIDYADILMVNEDIDLDALINKLIAGGYTRTPIVEDPGDFSVRGGIIDIFSPVYPNPFRAEMFGDMVESIRMFSASTQKKLEDIFEALIVPAKEAVIDQAKMNDIIQRVRTQASSIGVPVTKIRDIVENIKGESSSSDVESMLPLVYDKMDDFFDYVPQNSIFVEISSDEIKRNNESFHAKAMQNFESAVKAKKLAIEPDKIYLSWEDISEKLNDARHLIFRDFPLQSNIQDAENRSGLSFDIFDNLALSSQLKNSQGREKLLLPLAEWINDKKDKNYITIIICSTHSQTERLIELLMPYGIEPHKLAKFPELRNKGQVMICPGKLTTGFVWPDMNLAVITEDEIFGAKKRIKRSPGRKKGKEIFSFNELKEDNFVVHAEHGLGQYKGLEKITMNGITNDYLKLLFKDDDTLYLPVHRMGVIQKYVGLDGYMPLLNKMGGKAWDKVKDKAKKEVEKMAGALLKIFAERKVRNGYSFSPPCEYYRDFEAGFPYEETADQLSAIEDVLKDMEADTPMERLVCGDVGYGKTEVALRASFKAVLDKKQVAILVPTTVLAEQHLKTFTERLSKYAVRVEGLSRFKSRAAQKLIVEDLATGKVDIVIGTHRLLSKDIEFGDLGLIVIDEEQRFGVKHKEKLKKFRTNVDILTLTATPIPRTLHMSMTGIRDISVISTPPEERQAIITYVSELEDSIIIEGVRKELERDGQIFFVHNNVKTIAGTKDYIQKLIPELRIGIAHGQMNETDLEKVMMQFVNREIDMLLATTIIESGLDISTANTMFINKADRFGLSQMYQLRGRIGRSDDQAYAYLFIPEESRLSKDAKKRLRVLMEYSDLGAGFQIAMSDLQIRGGGAALGASQSGHIATIGYEMFLSLMENAVSDLKGQPVTEDLEPEINVSLSSFFPETYVPAIDQRLLIYRRLSSLNEVRGVSVIQEELVDRYGALPEEAYNVLLKTMLRIMAVKAGVKRLDIVGHNMVLQFSGAHQKNPHAIIDMITPFPERFELSPDQSLKVKMPKGNVKMMVVRAKKFLKEVAQNVNG